MRVECKRAGHSNRTGEIYEVGKYYEVAERNTRTDRFFIFPVNTPIKGKGPRAETPPRDEPPEDEAPEPPEDEDEKLPAPTRGKRKK
jgi:hypothetical protein